MESYKEIRIKSAAPFYGTGITWILYAILFPLYRWSDFLIVAVISVIVYVVCSLIFKGETVLVEEEIYTGNEALDDAISRGREFIKNLKSLRENIRNLTVKESITELIDATDAILSFILKYPEQTSKIRKLENYIMPTSTQLLEQYHELESQQQRVENVSSAMADIEHSLPELTKAYKNVLDNLYQDKALDISVEIEVLKNIMGQDGLLR